MDGVSDVVIETMEGRSRLPLVYMLSTSRVSWSTLFLEHGPHGEQGKFSEHHNAYTAALHLPLRQMPFATRT